MVPESEPRRPILMVSPSFAREVGSPTSAASKRSPCSRAQASIFTVPLTAGPSSSPVISSDSVPAGLPSAAIFSSAAAMKQAMPPFMSTAPRP